MQENKHTDADVARMLGIDKQTDTLALEHGRVWMFGNGFLNFGLSTPPGPEADANAAKYVLPWLRAQDRDFLYRVYKRMIVVNGGSLCPQDLILMEGHNLCTACLEAVNDGN